MFGSNGIIVSLCALLLVTAAAAEVVNLGQPCRAKNILCGRIVTDRATGREVLAMVDMNETTGAELLFVDFEKNTGRKIHCPGGAGAWGLLEVPGDKLVISTFYDGKFMVFDLKKMEFVKDVSFPGETYIWTLALGNDGRVYGGSYGNGKLGALNLQTYEVEDLGNPAPPNLYCRYTSSLPDGRILCSFSTEKQTTLIFDPATKKFEPVPKQLEGITSGLTWGDYFLTGARVFKGAALEVVDPPFPIPPAEKGSWYTHPSACSDDVLVIRQGTLVYAFRRGDKELTYLCDMGTTAARVMGVTRDNSVVCLRGQDYFVMKKGDKKARLMPIPVESGPRGTHFLRCDGKGMLWGGTTFGQTLFHMDPKTGKYVNTGIICNAGGEVYDVAFRNNKVYAVTYSGGDIVEYDPSKSWDQLNNKNPKVIASVGSKGFIRPTAGAKIGPDGKLYSGWLARYGTYGGAVSITDTETGETRLIENPLGEQGIYGVAADADFIYAGTSLEGNGLPSKKGEFARFGVLEQATGKVVYQQEYDGVGTVQIPEYDLRTKRLVMSVGGKVKLFDTVHRDFLTLPEDTPSFGCHIAEMRDGCLYYGSKNTVVKLDVRKRKWTKIADAPLDVNNVAVGPDGTVYFSCGADVYEISRK